MKLKKGDNVIVIAGKHKGAQGRISKIVADRVFVGGVNKIKHHIKAKTKSEKGQMVEREGSLNASNVMFLDSKSGKGSRIGKRLSDEKMVRFAKKSGNEIK